jgi:hypothetical protein
MGINMTDLITLEDYKTAKGLSSTSEDSKITPLIESVSQFIKTYCGRTFIDNYSTPKTEYFSIFWGDEFVLLSESPVVAITSVSERASLTEAYEPITSYYLDQENDSVYKIASDGINKTSFTQGSGSVKVVYTAGWPETPLDLKLAVIDLVTYYLKEEHKLNRSVGATSMQNAPGPSTAFSAELPAHIKRVLYLYKVY